MVEGAEEVRGGEIGGGKERPRNGMRRTEEGEVKEGEGGGGQK